MKTLVHSLFAVGLFILAGCGSAEQGGQQVSSQTAVGPKIELDGTDWNTPVTERDLANFLAVLEHLPDHEVPSFAKLELNQQFSAGSDPRQDVENLREIFRSVFDPQLQGAEWKHDRKLVASFEQMQITPEEFAALVTKISLAWSASAIRGEIPILATQRKLREQIAKLEFELQHPLPGQSEHEREHRVSSIRDTVALSELLDLISVVPEQSIQVMRANEDLLHRHLPPARLKAKFEQCIESSPKVIQVGHSSQ